jgi:tetratricopeptide (TPR) repeat protein
MRATTTSTAARRRAAHALARGVAARLDGHYKDAARILGDAVHRFERISGPHHLDLVPPLLQLGLSLASLARLVDAGALYQRALSILDARAARDSADGADLFRNLGGLEHAAGNWLRGERFMREAVRIRTRLLGSSHPRVADDLLALAPLLDRQGKFAEAEALYMRGLAIVEQAEGERHPAVLAALNNRAAMLQARGRLAQAELLYRRVRAIEVEQRGAAHPAVAVCTNNLATVLQARGRLREAAPLYRQAIASVARHLGPRHPQLAVCLENYAHLLRRQRRFRAAASVARRAAGILARIDAVNEDGVAVTGTLNPLATGFRLRARSSPIHRLGVFAEEAIPAGRKVIEYTGERISRRESGRRWNPKRSYLFELTARVHLDGAIGGSGAEYINHSCAPNLKTRILGEHIIYFSNRPIAAGEELTVDYRYDWDTDVMPCHCGAPSCRGTLNLPPPPRRRPGRGTHHPEHQAG